MGARFSSSRRRPAPAPPRGDLVASMQRSASSVGVAFGACEALAAAAHVLANLAFAYFHGKRAYGGAMGLLAALLALGFGLFVRSAHLGPAPPIRSRSGDSPVSPTSMPVSFV